MDKNLIYVFLNGELLFFGADKQKAVNNELKIEVVSAFHESADRKNVFSGKFFFSLVKKFDNARGAAKNNSVKTLGLKNSQVWTLDNLIGMV